MTGASTQFFGRADPQALLDALVADLVTRGVVSEDAAASARPLLSQRVAQGVLPSTAIVSLGLADDVVRRSLSTVSGFAAAPPTSQWDPLARSAVGRVGDADWGALLAVPVAVVAGRPLVAFADTAKIASSAALALPPHEACVALEHEVRAALATPAPKPQKAAVAFLAPPSALLGGGGLGASPSAFSAGTAPALGATRAGAIPVTASSSAAPSSSPPAPAMPSVGPLAALSTPMPGGASPFATPTPGPAVTGGAGTMVGVVPSTSAGAPSPSLSPPVVASPLPPPQAVPAPPEGRTMLGHAGPASTAVVSFEPPAGFDQTLLGPAALSSSSPSSSSPVLPPLSAPAVAPPAVSPAGTLLQVPAPSTSVAVGSRCGRFTLQRRLGEGGMATVFIGVPDDGGPSVAVKVVHDHLLRSSIGDDLRRRFQREVSAMRQLHHKNIVACVDAGRVDDTEYLATEFVGGGSLSDLLERTGRLPAPLALSFFGDLLEGLAHAHDKGIIHRDLKPDNLLLDTDGTLKIADFGIARVTEGTALTATGTFVGTPAYMSPEQAMANPVDVRSDLYSAGVILYELLSGRNPFADAQVMTTLANVLQGNWRPLGEVEVSTPLLVDHVVARLLSTRPDDRLPSTRAVLAALQPLLDEARAWRDLWREVVVGTEGAMGRAMERAADELTTTAKREQQAGEPRRLSAGLLAFRATSLSPDHREARPMLRALGHGTTMRFGRSPNLYAMEADAEKAGDRRRAFRDVARAYLAEQNPNFAASWARRAVNSFGLDDEDVVLLTTVMPEAEVEQLTGLAERAGLPRSQQLTMLGRQKAPRASDAPPRSSVKVSLSDMGGPSASPVPALTSGGPAMSPLATAATATTTTTAAMAGTASTTPSAETTTTRMSPALWAAGGVIAVLLIVIAALVMRGGG